MAASVSGAAGDLLSSFLSTAMMSSSCSATTATTISNEVRFSGVVPHCPPSRRRRRYNLFHFRASYMSVTPQAYTEPGTLIPGRADYIGTSQYAQRIGADAGPGHFRKMAVGGELGDLIVSSLGLGTFGGSDHEEVDKDIMRIMLKGFDKGVNVIDTASNYRNTHSEICVGRCFNLAVRQGTIKRNEVVLCTKGGFLSFDYTECVDPRSYIEERYIKTGLFKWEEVIGGIHCLSTPFILHQLEMSRINLGVETIDIYYIHNPEVQMGVIPRQTTMARLRSLFAGLEKAAQDGKISMYGISSFSAFRTMSSAKNHLSLEELVKFAKEAGGENHHFKVVMVPLNIRLQDVAKTANQSVRGKRYPLLEAASMLGINVIASSPLFQGSLSLGITPAEKAKFPELGVSRTDVQCCLQFTRTTPGVLTTLNGMSKLSHWHENSAIIRCPATYRPIASP